MAGNSDESYDKSVQSSDDSHHFERLHVESIYDSFICPLTKQVMQDPVSLENGQTFEREAIEKWLRDCSKNGGKPVCPVTYRELRSTELNPSIALRNTIGEWNARNEAAKLDLARRSLSLSSNEDDIKRALKYVDHLCLKTPSKRHVIHQEGLIPGIADVLKSTSRQVRCKALETLRIVVESDSNNKVAKELLAEGDTVRTIVKFLSHEPSKEREEAVSLLYELSKSELLCDKIGSVVGAIIILVGMASSNSEDLFTVEKAEKTLENLAQCENNVRQMAEYGRLQPLLTLLLEGSPETKVAMASVLGELALNNDMKVLVAKIAGSSLIVLMKSSNMQSREASLKALNQISSDETSAKILIELGILPPLVKNLFTVGTNLFPMRLKEICATILSNIVNSGHDFDSIPVGPNNQTLVSNDVIHNLLQLISNTGPSIECKLLQVLVGLTNSPSTVLSLVSAIKSFGATISLVQFIEAPQRDLRLTALKLLQNLSPHMGPELAYCLRGQLGSLISIVSENIGITEEQVAAVGLLANLPERDTSLTKQMMNEDAFPLFVSRIVRIRQGQMRGTRFMTPYQEGLVKVLARITFALAEEPARALCRELDLTALFIELLQANGLDNVQMVSAMALENLSLESKNLTKLPEFPLPGLCGSIFPCLSKPHVINGLCKIHGGTCTLRETFCLLDGQAVDKLVSLLDHTNEKVVEASLAAISTLIEDGVNVEEGIKILIEGDAIKSIFDILLESRTENLKRRSVWAVERLLRNEDLAYGVASDPNISTALVDAYQYGDSQTQQNAERALRHVDRIPNFSGIYPNA